MQNQRLLKTLIFFKDLNKNCDMMSLFLKTFKDFKDPWGPCKLRERNHSFAGFNTYVTRYFIENYSDKKICDVPACFACK